MRRDAGDEFNIISEDEEGEEIEGDLFEAGQLCDVCGKEEGRVGLDPTCRGVYDGDPALYCYTCAPEGLKDAYKDLQGVAAIVEPFGEYSAHYYYRLDEMPAYQFVREDTESVSWLMLTIGGPCARCGEQGHVAWLGRKFVDEKLPEGRAVFRNLDADIEHLCFACASAALAEAYASLKLPMMTVELPRSAMGVMMPTGE